jgi:hypothetical protein
VAERQATRAGVRHAERLASLLRAHTDEIPHDNSGPHSPALGAGSHRDGRPGAVLLSGRAIPADHPSVALFGQPAAVMDEEAARTSELVGLFG